MLFRRYFKLLPLNFVYFVVENGNFVLKMSWKIIYLWLWEPCFFNTKLNNVRTCYHPG